MLAVIMSQLTIQDYMNKTGKAFNLVEFYETSKANLATNEHVLNPTEQLKRNLKHLTDFSVTQKKPKSKGKIAYALSGERSGLL